MTGKQHAPDAEISEGTSVELKLVLALCGLIAGIAFWVAKVEARLEKVEPSAQAIIEVNERMARVEGALGLAPYEKKKDSE